MRDENIDRIVLKAKMRHRVVNNTRTTVESGLEIYKSIMYLASCGVKPEYAIQKMGENYDGRTIRLPDATQLYR